MAKKKAQQQPAAIGRSLKSAVVVREVWRTPVEFMMTDLGAAADRDGRPVRVIAGMTSNTVYVEREGLPTRYVALPDLLAAILDAEG